MDKKKKTTQFKDAVKHLVQSRGQENVCTASQLSISLHKPLKDIPPKTLLAELATSFLSRCLSEITLNLTLTSSLSSALSESLNLPTTKEKTSK